MHVLSRRLLRSLCKVVGVIAFCIPWRFRIGVVGGLLGRSFGAGGLVEIMTGVFFIIPYSMFL